MLQPVQNGAYMQLLTDAAIHSASIETLYLCTAMIPSSSILAGCGHSEPEQS